MVVDTNHNEKRPENRHEYMVRGSMITFFLMKPALSTTSSEEYKMQTVVNTKFTVIIFLI